MRRTQQLEVEEPSIPSKFANKSTEEIIDSYTNLEKELGRKAQEVGELRKLSEKALQDGISSKDIKKKLPKVRETLLKEGGAKVRILNFLYPGKGSRFDIDDQKKRI